MAPGRARRTNSSRVSSLDTLQSESQQPSSNASLQNTDSASTVSKKNTRGKTRGCHLSKMVHSMKKRLPINIDLDQGRPLNKMESAKLSNELGIIARTYLRCPITIKKLDWNTHIIPAFDCLSMKLDVISIDTNPKMADCVVAILKNRIRDYRRSLKLHYLSFPNVEAARAKKPNDYITQENWDDLCAYWNMDETKEKAEKAKKSRACMTTPHNQGSKAFVVVRQELDSGTGENHDLDRIQLYKIIHYDERKGWTLQQAEENYVLMQEKLEKAIEEEKDVNYDEICNEVLGNRSGYVKGLGYGPKPNASKCRHDKLINDLQVEKNEWKEKYEAEALENRKNRSELKKHSILLKKLLGPEYDDYDENTQSEEEDLT